MERHRGIPQQSPKKMADDLKRAYWKPAYVVEQNLAAAKTSFQKQYWRDVNSALNKWELYR